MAEETTPPVEPTPEPAEAYELDAEAPSAEPEPQPSPEPRRKHSPRLMRMGEDLGISQADMEEATPAQLETLIAYMTKQALAAAREQQVARTHRDAPPPPAPVKDDEIDLGLGDGEADFDPRLIAAIRKGFASRDKRIKELEAAQQGLGQHVQRREAETQAERIDRMFEDLGEGYKEQFGEGPGQEMEADSAEFQRRLAVLRATDGLKGSFEQKFKRAVKNLFGEPQEAAEAPAKPKAASEAEKWKNGGVNRPTQRKGPPEPKGAEKAKKAVAEVLRGMGGEQDTSPDEFLE